MIGRFKNKKPEPLPGDTCLYEKFQEYFKIGVSGDFIFLRDDFPIESVSPGDFKKILISMFKKNDEVRQHGK